MEQLALVKKCSVCDAEFTRREKEHDYLWQSRTVCSEKCGLAKQLKLGYCLHATHKTTGARWYVKTTYNHRTTPEYRHVIVSADGSARLQDGTGKGGRITREWKSEDESK